MTTRKRGITLSHLKLTKKSYEMGLKTQAALSRKIATIEKSDSIPTDIVKRAFSEKPIAEHSAQRIATALKAPLSSILLGSEDMQRDEYIKQSQHNEQDNKNQNNTTFGNNSPIVTENIITGDFNLNFNKD